MEIIAVAQRFLPVGRIDEYADVSLVGSLVGRETCVAVYTVGHVARRHAGGRGLHLGYEGDEAFRQRVGLLLNLKIALLIGIEPLTVILTAQGS